MRKAISITILLLMLTLSAFGCTSGEGKEITVTDMAGREVEISSKIESVFGVNNTSSILLYTLAPEKLIGWNIAFSDEAKLYMSESVQTLPILGNLYGSGKKADIEEILTYEPDVIIITDTKKTDKLISAADTLQEQSGIPVIVLIANMSNYPEVYAFLGEVLSEEKRAKELAEYTETLIEDIKQTAATISDEDKVSIYYAREDDGLTTEFKGSPNTEVLSMVGGINIAESELAETSGAVSLEQIIVWDPQVILIGNIGASETAAYKTITESGLWSDTTAVQNGMVYKTPSYPFNWFDRPPSVNRLIGLVWLAEKIYPDVYMYDTVEKTQEFFELFYGVEITSEQALTIMKE